MGQMNNKGSMKLIASILALLFSLPMTLVLADSAGAASCKPIKSTGKSVGEISLGSIKMPIKSFNYPAGGVMEPAKNTTSAGLSARHMPLSSEVGSSVIVWHRDYDGCTHKLNAFMSKKAGSTFSLVDENGESKKYRLQDVKVIKKGQYKASWFNLIGPRQVVMVTCTGVFKSGHYEKNMVFIATPV
jgi:hypothetical protein